MHLPKPTEGGEFSPCPAGTFIATCYRFVDLGTHVAEFNGDKKTRHEVLLSWEIADEFMEDGRPFTINKKYTWSMHEKATLRKHLEAWRKKPFADEDFDGPSAFDVKNVIGKPCTITVTHTNKDGKTYASVAGVGPMIKGTNAPPVHNKAVYLAITADRWDAGAYADLSDYYREQVASSPEYRELMEALRRPDDPTNGVHVGSDPSDDIPF